MAETVDTTADEQASREGPAAFRRKAFVDAATSAFLARGYDGTTMSSIAAMVGGSKTTLWNYFPSKEVLFAAVVDDVIARHGIAQTIELPLDDDVRMVLERFARALIKTLSSAPVLDLFRLVIGEAKRFPHLAELFYDRGARRGRTRLATYFAELMERGKLRSGDPFIAAQQFSLLCQSGTFELALFDLAEPDPRTPLGGDVAAAVDTFYRAWGPDSQRRS